MKAKRNFAYKLSLFVAVFCVLSISLLRVGLIPGQETPKWITADNVWITGLPEDWTYHHLVFSNPGTEDDSYRNGTHDEWLRIVNDPRYIMQQLKRGLPAQGPAAEDVARVEEIARTSEIAGGRQTTAFLSTNGTAGAQAGIIVPTPPIVAPVPNNQKMTKDWNEALGATTAPSYATYPAKWSFDTTSASCTNDFVIYPTGQAGSASRASIIAYYNLYTSGCSGTVPLVDWAYNTGGTVVLSPQFSSSGSQVAFVQSSSGGAASLVLLKFPLTPPGTGTLTSPTTPTSVTATNYPSCSAPCMTSIAFSGTTTPNDVISNGYYDYHTDSLYVGATDGKLHKFAPVFNGTLAEVTTSGWPVTLNAGTDPTSPVYDPTSGCVFVGDVITGTTGGYLYSVESGNPGAVCTSTTASVHGTSGQLDVTYGIRDAPLVDPTAARVYAFVGNDSSGNNGVFQFPTSFTSGSGTEVTVGSGGTGATAYQLAGTFDNAYYTSSSGSSPSGNLYVCGTGAPATLYQIPINSNSMGTVATGPAISSSSYYGRCSPVTEFFNTSAPRTANGTVTLITNPSGWATGSTVTIGATTYTFVTTLTGTNQVLLVTSHSSGTNETDTAKNLEAVINATSSECSTSGCVHSGQLANASVSATESNNVVTLTAKTSGTGGNFTLSTNYSTEITVSGGPNGSATDYIFLSVYFGTQSGCTQSTNNGCVMSFDVTTPSTFSSGLTPGGALNVSAPTSAAPTGGLIVDNALNSPAGSSQIYFLTLYTSGTSPCSGICAVQASQAAP